MASARNDYSCYSRDGNNLGPVGEETSSQPDSSSNPTEMPAVIQQLPQNIKSERTKLNLSRVSHSTRGFHHDSYRSLPDHCPACWPGLTQRRVHRPPHEAAPLDTIVALGLASCRCPAQNLQDVHPLNQCLEWGNYV